MLTTVAAGAALAATATQLANATDYVQQLQGLLRATEAALDTANKLNATSSRWLTFFKPVFTARAHYKEALDIYSVAIETITPCIADMEQNDALEFLRSATTFLEHRKSIYESSSYKRNECIKLRKNAIILKENADRSRAQINVDHLVSVAMKEQTAARDAHRAGNVAQGIPPVMQTGVAIPYNAVGQATTSRNPFIDPRYTTTATADPNVSGPSVQASA